MANPREQFLKRVRDALQRGKQPGHGQAPPARTAARAIDLSPSDQLARFTQELATAGGACHVVHTASEAITEAVRLLERVNARGIVVGRGSWIDSLNLENAMRGGGRSVWTEPLQADEDEALWEASKRQLFAADAGITAADWLIAETGSVVQISRAGQARSLSLLPPLHIVLARQEDLLSDLFDLFREFETDGTQPITLPACVTLITGPSKTGDIELTLVTGVHGPGEVHVILVVP